jgi:SsrA-binding protein
MSKHREGDLVSNRRATFEYEILETLEAGIVLQGTEVKSLKDHGGNLQDSYISISDTKATLKNASIALYKFGNIHNHEEKKDRILLLHKRELFKLKECSDKKGLTLIPLAFYLKKGIIKVKIAVAKGKKSHDKREAIKEKEQKKVIERALKNQNF